MGWRGNEHRQWIDIEIVLNDCTKRLDGQTYPQSNADERWKKDKRNIKCKCS